MNPLHAAAVDHEVREIMALVNASFRDVPDKVTQLRHQLGSGMQKALIDGWDDDEIEVVYAEAHRLFGEQRHEEALPLALHLSVNRPLDPRFMFMTGLILQLLGDPLLAASFYATLLSLDPHFVPAAFRMAECYAALGEHTEARDIFELAIDMGHETMGDANEFYALQRVMMEKLSVMN